MMLDDPNLVLIKDILGYTSTTLLALLYIPQTFWVYYKRQPEGLTWVFLVIGLFLTIDTIAYGILLNEPPLIAANVIAFTCMVLLMIAKCLWSKVPEVQEVQV